MIKKDTNLFTEAYTFAYKQALSLVFPVFIFAMLALTKNYSGGIVGRYDLLFISLVVFQLVLLFTKLESFKEFRVIILFHFIGLVFELYKVNQGSWSYPDPAIFKVFGVPLYSGFMYASVASYIIQAWRHFNVKIYNWPAGNLVTGLSLFIFANFITNHYIPDFRILLLIAIVIIFRRTVMEFTVKKLQLKMPVTLVFISLSILIWIAENISTFLEAWTYPHQQQGWQNVDLLIASSWLLLVVFVFTLTVNHKLNLKDKISE